MLVLYLKRNCPYCNMVLEKLENSDIETQIYWEGEDFTTSEFKENYGKDATFPRGFEVKNGKNRLLKDSDKIIKYIELN